MLRKEKQNFSTFYQLDTDDGMTSTLSVFYANLVFIIGNSKS